MKKPQLKKDESWIAIIKNPKTKRYDLHAQNLSEIEIVYMLENFKFLIFNKECVDKPPADCDKCDERAVHFDKEGGAFCEDHK